MPDPLSVRVSEQVQEKFKAFADSDTFRNQGEFFSHLLTLYEAQETSIHVPTLEGAVNAVTDMADRVCKILTGTGETIIINQQKLKNEAETLRQEAEENRKAMAAENESLKTQNAEYLLELDVTQKTYANSLSEKEAKIKDIERNLNVNIALNNEYRKNNENLESEIKRQNELITKAKSVLDELNQLRFTAKEQDLKIKGLELDNEKALGDLEKAFRNEISSQQAEHAVIVNDYERKLLEMGNAQLERDKTLRDEMGLQQSAYAAGIKEYEDKVKSLLDELERRPIITKAPSSNSTDDQSILTQ